ncbi:hypothetical protein PVT68_07290 [Microbulbifer bruguierae]|uniref:STAS/SEC14 domain-containing protein n=1 Tax=Microbulbifer bruguierae TaxID=3029061 RepID=A0ABY8NGM4_9GAMM|nr:hypothetical protein [Microbulbifer bruguierae]WGL18090.1 hypothetical protein PVT68_07290 [Microbulbifer bruguierae]
MSFQIRFNPDTRIVTAVFFDRVDFSDKVASARQIAEKFGHLHPLLLLVDVRRADIVLSVDERREFGTFAAHLQGLSHCRAAVLHAVDHNANAIIDSAAQAEGMHIREFVTEQTALTWLAGNADGDRNAD